MGSWHSEHIHRILGETGTHLREIPQQSHRKSEYFREIPKKSEIRAEDRTRSREPSIRRKPAEDSQIDMSPIRFSQHFKCHPNKRGIIFKTWKLDGDLASTLIDPSRQSLDADDKYPNNPRRDDKKSSYQELWPKLRLVMHKISKPSICVIDTSLSVRTLNSLTFAAPFFE
jgi:hypothetical protein